MILSLKVLDDAPGHVLDTAITSVLDGLLDGACGDALWQSHWPCSWGLSWQCSWRCPLAASLMMFLVMRCGENVHGKGFRSYFWPWFVLLGGGALQACPGFSSCSHPGLLDETYMVRMAINIYSVAIVAHTKMLVCNDKHGKVRGREAAKFLRRRTSVCPWHLETLVHLKSTSIIVWQN